MSATAVDAGTPTFRRLAWPEFRTQGYSSGGNKT